MHVSDTFTHCPAKHDYTISFIFSSVLTFSMTIPAVHLYKYFSHFKNEKYIYF